MSFIEKNYYLFLIIKNLSTHSAGVCADDIFPPNQCVVISNGESGDL